MNHNTNNNNNDDDDEAIDLTENMLDEDEIKEMEEQEAARKFNLNTTRMVESDMLRPSTGTPSKE